MLNAFRHHCIQHPRAISPADPPIGAQRLSASLHSTLEVYFEPHAGPRGAQRLSASLHSTPSGEFGIWSTNVDACSTPFGITAFNTFLNKSCRKFVEFVLNAFRHHCIQHERESTRGAEQIARCSTPFGITS
ncbi:MAG: hypothetical protein NZU63_15025 [Gemmataceae bacterium]|nr:hypothetical protein [Gemmataceae bacterium]MDW8244902.1 hypothetical protein [Thermogemmata sp.]